MSSRSQMHISSRVYRELYDMLLKRFSEKELTPKERDRYSGYEPYRMWEAEDDKGNSKFRIVFGQERNELYFYSKLSQDIEKNPYVSLKVETMIKALEYLGLQIPESIKGIKKPLPGMKAKILYQLFLEDYFPGFLEENIERLKVYDKENHELIRNPRENDPVNTSITKSIAGSVSPTKEMVVIKQLINRFYGFISQEKLEDAWNLLAPSFQKRRWEEEFEKFRVGYTNTVSIYNIHVFEIVNKGDDILCKVYYEDEIITYTSYDVSKLNTITVSNINAFINQIKELQKSASAIGMKEFNRVELHKFFEPALSEYLWYRCGIKPEQIKDLLHRQENITVSRLCRISCTCIDGNWLIKGIQPVKNYAIR